MYSCQQRRNAEARSNSELVEPGGPIDPSVDGGKRNRADDKARKRREAENRRLRAELVGSIEKRIAKIEERVAGLESEQKVRSEKLADPAIFGDASQRDTLFSAYQSAAAKIDELTGRWEALTDELERAEATLATRLAELGD
jgi:ATP-binding cassette subfamily F protein 3